MSNLYEKETNGASSFNFLSKFIGLNSTPLTVWTMVGRGNCRRPRPINARTPSISKWLQCLIGPTFPVMAANEFLKPFLVKGVGPTAYYVPNFVSESESEFILRNVYAASEKKWTVLRNRRLQQLGGTPTDKVRGSGVAASFLYKGMISQPLPVWLHEVVARVGATGAIGRLTPNHVLINEYVSGQGIMPHTDGPLYTPVICTVSLGAHTVIDFSEALGGESSGSLLLQPRSLLVVADHLYAGLHGIGERTYDTLGPEIKNLAQCEGVEPGATLQRGTRVSLTIRNVPLARALRIGR
jgi:alkylated DNA repair protein alkB family protein 6